MMFAERQSQQEPFEGPFLGVTQSANGYIWRDRLKDAEQANLAMAISQRFDLPEVLGRVLAARGVGLEDVDIALNPTLKSLMPDPFELRDMERAAERVADAIEAQEQVAIFGDYDVDGASSSALLDRLFQAHGLSPIVYIPDRINEGYGPNAVAIEHLLGQGVDVIIAVDCGTNSFDAFAPALDKGKTVIVVDHHQADERLPDVHALVNPNRQDDLSSMGGLAAAGVVFLLLVAVVRCLKARKYYGDKAAPDLLEYLDIVALSTVCDVVPLQGLNRAYVTKGLQVMRRRENLGLKTLADVAGLKTAPTTYHLGYLLGPRINAGGRIGDSGLGAKLLATSDAHEANDIATRLDRLNNERKEMENRILEEALAEAEREVESDPDLPIVIVGSPDWHKGLVGLVSSRLT
ncbi:MAG: single-stranded-DNA-specific exonuclease RecJ, partial [Methyloligellaceae bacterium]